MNVTNARALICALISLAALAAPAAHGQLRVVTWNITNYSGGRVDAFQTAIYGSFQGRSLAPDAIIAQELLSQAGVNAFVSLLNTDPASPGDWAAAPFINGPDTDSAFFYRTTKVNCLGVTTVATGGYSPNHPRNIQRYDLRPVGYSSAGATLACYSSHMKSGSSSSDFARRLLEAQRIRADAETLPTGWHFLLGGDFNIPTASQSAYQELVGSQANNTGRFFDPIATAGSWQNNSYYRYVHTQDPAGAGGMDDRFDQLLVSASLGDGAGFDYLGDFGLPYSTSTWDDASHTYRVWGNDGTSYNTMLTTTGNQMVGDTIALALVASANGQGHLPVVMDLVVPAQLDAPTTLDFGEVAQGDVATLDLVVSNAGDVNLWTAAGIADLNYSLSASAGFAAPAGTFADVAGGGGHTHNITMDTSTTGPHAGTLTITSDAPDDAVHVITLTGTVTTSQPTGDFDGDGDIDWLDFSGLTICMAGPDRLPTPPDPPFSVAHCLETVDLDQDQDVDLEDIHAFIQLFMGS